MSSTERNIHYPTVLLSIAALVVAIISAYLSYTQSPLFVAQPHEITYWVEGKNTLNDDATSGTSTATVTISNESTKPAKNVVICLSTLTDDPQIGVDAAHEILDGAVGKVIQISTVPAKTEVVLIVTEQVSDYPVIRSVPKYQWWVMTERYYAEVIRVSTDFGVIDRLKANCAESIDPLPDDELEQIKQRLRI